MPVIFNVQMTIIIYGTIYVQAPVKEFKFQCFKADINCTERFHRDTEQFTLKMFSVFLLDLVKDYLTFNIKVKQRTFLCLVFILTRTVTQGYQYLFLMTSAVDVEDYACDDRFMWI